MLSWILDAWRRRKRARSRALFRFFDGRSTRAVDPFAVYRAFDAHDAFRWDMLPAINRSEEEMAAAVAAGNADLAETIRRDADQMAEATLDACCRAFGLARYDERTGAGLAASEIFEVFEAFTVAMDRAKKKPAPTSTSSSPTAGECSTAMGRPRGTGSCSSGCG